MASGGVVGFDGVVFDVVGYGARRGGAFLGVRWTRGDDVVCDVWLCVWILASKGSNGGSGDESIVITGGEATTCSSS